MKKTIAEIKRILNTYGEAVGRRRRATYNFGRYEDKRKRVCCRVVFTKSPQRVTRVMMNLSMSVTTTIVVERKNWRAAWEEMYERIQRELHSKVKTIERDKRLERKYR